MTSLKLLATATRIPVSGLAAQDERTAKDKSPGVNNRGHENAFKSGTPTDSSRFYLCRPQASFL
ncbi:MAG: hypothetical protein QF745_11160, partial [Planctomycetota bacterium]|nr:hypothetical protein [Planctomycetota bacterium]